MGSQQKECLKEIGWEDSWETQDQDGNFPFVKRVGALDKITFGIVMAILAIFSKSFAVAHRFLSYNNVVPFRLSP